MNELLEYKEIFLNYPRKSIKEMERLLVNNEKEEFIKAYMHNIYSLSCNIYKKYPKYFESFSIMDIVEDGNELIVKLYNKGIRDFKQFTCSVYYNFYIRTLHKIKVSIVIKDLYLKLYKKNGKAPTLAELSKISGISIREISNQDVLGNCFAEKYLIYFDIENISVDYIMKKDIINILKKYLDQLNSEERNILFRYYFDSETFREIAKAYNSSCGAIYSKTQVALRKIRFNMCRELVKVLR